MTVSLAELDAHEQPSDEMRTEWKYFSRLEPSVLVQDPRIDDPRLPLSENGFQTAGTIYQHQVTEAFEELGPGYGELATGDLPIIFHDLLPGLLIVPNLVPPPIQKVILSKLLHRDLSDPQHQTNLHLHYTLPYPSPSPSHASSSPNSKSFFTLSPESPATFTPHDPTVHKPLTARQVLTRRLHWVTLGGQYDWTNRIYPPSEPPRFPPDLSGFLEKLFPETEAQAAIVNFYSPGDTMMMHRDVSEETDKGLVSLSLGCDGLFMIAPSNAPEKTQEEDERKNAGDTPNGDQINEKSDATSEKKKYLLLRLRSGDAIYMTKESRYAWHGVPKVIKGTCPDYLENWPAEDGHFADWEGWMKNKRINLNVRQMRE